MDPFLPPYTPTELPPPVYGLSLSIPTPSYPLPTTFTIGPNRLSEPLVTPEQIKAHLKLLRAFGELKLDVERSSWAGEKGGRGDTLGWAWFVDLAVHRFEKWITTLPVKRISDTTIFVESHIPPLDVLIVWHAYLLHPTKYARDRRANNTIDRLPRIYNNLIDIVKYIGDPGTSTPTKERAISWRKSTNTPFDPIQSASEILPARMNTHPIDEKKSQEKCEDPARNSLLTQIAEGSSPYRPFSFELVGAVFRQSTFTTKMHDIGWTDPSFLESTRGNVVLRYTIVRYHAFLDIFSSHRHESLIPTLDISLAWHTHQTYDDQYAWDCERWMVSGKEQFKWDWTERRFEFEDKIDAVRMETSLHQTRQIWKDQFSSEYIQCPCSPPSPSQKPQANTGGDVSPSCDDPMLLYGTHPSVHTTSKLDDHSKEDQHSGKGKGKGKCKDDQYELDLHLDLDRNKDEGDESKVDRACIMGCTPIHKFTSGPCPASRQVCPLTGRTCWTSGYTHVEGSQKIEYDDLHGPLMTESWDRPWSLGLGRRLEQDRGEGSSRSGWKVWKRWKGK